MKAQTVDAISYCFDLLSFIFQNKDAGKRIKSVHLFGSAVRGELECTVLSTRSLTGGVQHRTPTGTGESTGTPKESPRAKRASHRSMTGGGRFLFEKESDIDIFVECEKEDEKRVQSLVNSGIVKFTASQDHQKWKLFHFTYPFSIQVGQLEEWELKVSISSEGILLYNQKGISNAVNAGERKVLFIINYSKKKNEYIKVRRLIFGRDESYYQGTGLLSKYRGQRISANVFIIPKEYQTLMMEALSKEKVIFSMKEIAVLD